MEKIATENRRKQTIFLFYFLQIKRFKLNYQPKSYNHSISVASLPKAGFKSQLAVIAGFPKAQNR